jgi:hypothetical protein
MTHNLYSYGNAKGVIGMSFKVVTSVKSSDAVKKCIDDFLIQYRSELLAMKNDTFMAHLAGLAKNKLESFDSLEEECSNYWSEISEGRYDFDVHREEVHCLRSITKEKMMSAYDSWIAPVCEKGFQRKRRGMVFHVIGSGDGAVSEGRPRVSHVKPVGEQVDDLVTQFHEQAKDTWGRIMFGNAIKRANTD